MTMTLDRFDPYDHLEKPLFYSVLALFFIFFLILGSVIPQISVPAISKAVISKPNDVAITLSIKQIEEKKELKTQLLIKKKPVPEAQIVKNKKMAKARPKRIVKTALKKVEAKTKAPKITNRHDRAAVSGLLAFKDTLADMRESIDSKGLSLSSKAAKGTNSGEYKINRNLLTSQASKSSGGIETRKFSKESKQLTKQLNGALLSDIQTTKMEAAPIIQKTLKNDTKKPGGGLIGRSQEDIRRAWDQNVGSIFSLYYRALRKQPDMLGSVTVELTIDAKGKTQCKIISSEIDNEELLNKMVARIKLFDFGLESTPLTVVNKTINFTPRG